MASNSRFAATALCAVAASLLVATAPRAESAHVDLLVQQGCGDLCLGGYDFVPPTEVLPENRSFSVVLEEAVLEEENEEGETVEVPIHYTTQAPGFVAREEDLPPGWSPLPAGSDLLYFFLSDPMLGRNLSFWDGLGDVDFGPVPDDEVFVGLIPAGFLEFELTVADGADADVGGSLVATTDPGGRLHDHVSFFLYGDDTPVETPGERAADLATPGVYLISLGVAVVDESGAEPIERTAPPGYALFAAGDVDPAALGAATEWVDTVLVPEPSAAAGAAAALAALAFLRGARRRRPARLAALVASLGLVAAGGAARAERLAYSEGHADLQVALVDEGGEPAFFALESFLRAEGAVIGGELVAGPSDFEAEQIEIAVPDATRESLTQDQIDFFHFQPIGVDAGEPFWRLPQDQGAADDRRAPFLGLAATEIEAGLLEEGRVFLHLVEMEAPAGAVVSAWQTVLGPTPFAISTADGIEEDDFVRLGAGSHAHYNLGFTQPGTYDLTFEPRATLAGSAAPVTGSVTYRFVVPEPSLKAAGLGALAALSLLAACRSGTPARRGR